MESLRQVYLWQTAVTDDGVAALRAARPDLVVDTGAEPPVTAGGDEPPPMPLPSCCVEARAAGKACEHPCCVAAAKEGKVCEKCAGGA
jgi:hypothetical protein